MRASNSVETVILGTGRSIQPPPGWEMSGRVADDPLRLQPGSRVSFRPGSDEHLNLSWSQVSWLVGKPEADYFRMLLDRERKLSGEDLEPLYPVLIRFLLTNVTDASVVTLPGAGRALSVNYLLKDAGMAGQVNYLPSAEIPGEVQILSYEGKELPYLTYFEAAMNSLASFRDETLTSSISE
jgi:hypothetical protein